MLSTVCVFFFFTLYSFHFVDSRSVFVCTLSLCLSLGFVCDDVILQCSLRRLNWNQNEQNRLKCIDRPLWLKLLCIEWKFIGWMRSFWPRSLHLFLIVRLFYTQKPPHSSACTHKLRASARAFALTLKHTHTSTDRKFNFLLCSSRDECWNAIYWALTRTIST